MSKIRKFFYLILIVNILYSSCKNDNKLNSKTYINTNKLISSEQNKKQADKEKILYLELPDSIKAPTLINGKIHYNTQLTPFENKVTSSRYLFLHINFDQNPKDYDLESLKNNPRSLMFEDTTLT